MHSIFTFEHRHELSEAEYVALWAIKPDPRRFRMLSIFGVGVALLFWSYTVALGIVILVVAAVAEFLPHSFPGTAARNFREFRYLTGPLTYGVSNERLWVRSQDFTAEVSWRHVTVWRERLGWLCLQGNGFPPVILPAEELKAKGLYDQVKALASIHSVEYGSAEAKRQVVS